jgi:hypothetical protein
MDGVGVAVGFYGERSVLGGVRDGGGAGGEFGRFYNGRGGEFGWLEIRGVRREVFSVRRGGKTNRVLIEVVEGVLGRKEQSG